MSFFAPQRLSCGVVVLNVQRELLLCHVTGQNHWDLPKGGIDAGETPREAALRETREETGLQLDAEQLTELGRYKYTAKKDLHLYATLLPRLDLSAFRCESRYLEHASGRHMPEMDGFGWFGFDRIAALCTPKMAAVLRTRLDLDRVVDGLLAAPGTEQTNAEPFMMQLSV
jgi:8-oxo-dGTP pyrophosphatase MutT (NUDIX family)